MIFWIVFCVCVRKQIVVFLRVLTLDQNSETEIVVQKGKFVSVYPSKTGTYRLTLFGQAASASYSSPLPSITLFLTNRCRHFHRRGPRCCGELHAMYWSPVCLFICTVWTLKDEDMLIQTYTHPHPTHMSNGVHPHTASYLDKILFWHAAVIEQVCALVCACACEQHSHSDVWLLIPCYLIITLHPTWSNHFVVACFCAQLNYTGNDAIANYSFPLERRHRDTHRLLC